MRLRQFWERAGALRDGVLVGKPFEVKGRIDDRALPGSGWCGSLSRSSGVCDAYRRISGTWNITEKGTNTDTRSANLSLDVNAGKDFFGPVMALLTGGLVGTGVATAGAGGAAAAFLSGVGAALASALAVKAGATASRSRSRSREDNFLFDLSAANARPRPADDDRIAHRVRSGADVRHRRARQGGRPLREDEQDRHPLEEVRRRAAGSSAFLTDRDTTSRRSSGATATTPSTPTFSHRIFVVFKPEDLQRLSRSGLSWQTPDPSAAIAATPTAEPADQNLKTDELERALLQYVVLHRARMHTIDVQREVAQLRGRTPGGVKLKRNSIRSSPAFQLDLVIQVAIELALSSQVVAAELDRDPSLYRLVYDAMYYLSRLWGDLKTVRLGDADRPLFERYLSDRFTSQKVVDAEPKRDEAKPAAGSIAEESAIPDATRQLLWDQVPFRGVAACRSRAVRDAVESTKPRAGHDRSARIAGGRVRGAASSRRSIRRCSTRSNPKITIYEWSYDPSGRRLRAPAALESARAVAGRRHRAASARQRAQDAAGRRRPRCSGRTITERLPRSPAWEEVDEANRRLKRFRRSVLRGGSRQETTWLRTRP
jgi:hypothetical protein